MSEAAGALRRGVLVAVAVYSILTALSCAIYGCGDLMARAYDAADMPPLLGFLLVAYAVFLLAFATGLLREREWA